MCEQYVNSAWTVINSAWTMMPYEVTVHAQKKKKKKKRQNMKLKTQESAQSKHSLSVI